MLLLICRLFLLPNFPICKPRRFFTFMLTLSNLSKRFGPKILFREVSLRMMRVKKWDWSEPMARVKLRCYLSYLESSEDEGMVEWERAPVLGIYPREAPTGDETVLELATPISDELRNSLKVLRENQNLKVRNDWKLRKSLQNSKDSISKPKQRKYWLALPFSRRTSTSPQRPLVVVGSCGLISPDYW